MSVQTLQFIEVDSDPLTPGSGTAPWAPSRTEYLQPEWIELANTASPLADALCDVIEMVEEATCDNCKGMVGYHLLETDDGRLEHAYWHYVALILHGPQFPVVRLCEDCAAPVIQPPAPVFPNPLRRSAIWGA